MEKVWGCCEKGEGRHRNCLTQVPPQRVGKGQCTTFHNGVTQENGEVKIRGGSSAEGVKSLR